MEVLSLWPLTARAAELDVFSRVWGTARGRSVVVFGPAGVGKSRLAEEFLARATRGGVPRGRATASAAAARVPLGAIAHLLPAGVDLADPVRGFAQVASVLGGSGRARVVMIDDLHWLDAASAILLRQLLDAGSIRLIGTVRAGEPINEAVQLLCTDDAVCRIDLAAFNLQQVEQVVRAALGGVVGRHTVRRLYDASGGNALYLRELVSGALAAGALAGDGEIWELAEGRMAGTPRLVELIGARLQAAGPDGRTVLELLALCEPVPLADAEAVAGMDVLVDLEAAGLIRTRTDSGGTDLSLAHPLYAEVIRADIAPLRSRKLLLDQADRARAGGGGYGLDTRRIAAWQLEATGHAEPALLIEAAALARHAHDYVQARSLLQALAEEDHTTASRVMLGEVLWQLGDAVQADAVLAAAASAAANEHEFLAVTMARAANRFWGEGDHLGTFELFEKARERVTDPACLKSLRHVEGTMRISAGDPRRGLELLEDLAEDVAESAADPVAWLNAASAIPGGLSHVGRTQEALAWADRAYRAHQRIADQVLFAHPASQLISGVVAMTAAGRLAEARETAETAIAQLAEAHAPAINIWMIVYLGYLELLAGRVADARRWFAEAAALARTLSRTSAMNLALVGLALAAALLGDVDAAELAAAEANGHPIQPVYGHWNALAAVWLRVARGQDPQTVRTLLSEAAERARISGLVYGEALLLAGLARLGGAEQAAPRLGEIAETFDGALVPALAQLAAALAADEPEPLLAAAGELAGIGADLMAAEAATAASAAYARSGDSRRASAAAQEARRHLEKCGDEPPRTPLLQASQATASLTERELEIAQMAAHGVPSREIAEALHVSVRTVQNHLQRAYTKLGVTSRGELARALG